nr:Glutathione import ATP-binding protein GsiA [Candidatus Pantoea persica]
MTHTSLPDAAGVADPDGEPVLAIEHLSISFRGRSGAHQALHDVSFAIQPGEIVAVVGESGSGKSVTSLAVMGLLGGAICFRDRAGTTHDLSQLCDERRRRLCGREMAMIFQEPMTSLNPVLRVDDQLTESLRDHQLCSGAEAQARARSLLRQVRIADVDRVMKSYPHAFSGGMRQRVMIAQALACDPQLLIADEPTTALDMTVQARILHILRELQHEKRMAVLFIPHDMGVVAEVADRVVVMYRGNVVEQGPVQAIFAAPQHDYTCALLAAVPKPGDICDQRWPQRFPLLRGDVMGDAQHITVRCSWLRYSGRTASRAADPAPFPRARAPPPTAARCRRPSPAPDRSASRAR